MFPVDPKAPRIAPPPPPPPTKPYNPYARLEQIAAIIEAVDNRCAAVDGPVTPTLQEMTQREISEIYALATGRKS